MLQGLPSLLKNVAVKIPDAPGNGPSKANRLSGKVLGSDWQTVRHVGADRTMKKWQDKRVGYG